MAAPLLAGPTFFLDSFALRQWDTSSTSFIDCEKQAFLDKVHELFEQQGSVLVDGYAPFCKHVFVKNFTSAKLNCLEITDANRGLLHSGYTRRRPEELAVLARWFRATEVEVPTAAHLDLILYSREQLVKVSILKPRDHSSGTSRTVVPLGSAGVLVAAASHAAVATSSRWALMPISLCVSVSTTEHLDLILYSREQLVKEYEELPESARPVGELPPAPWGIISIKAQTEGHETPMQPITQLRNSLGRAEGGSGVPINRAAYEASTKYWDAHAVVSAGDSPDGE
ncbi:hypothetical protein FOA52_010962 [Chlamydomonas sp. UWO 241]|nr:hypothetical protein FOA52_010962 [Chlamydomonas sp. UWO 241]